MLALMKDLIELRHKHRCTLSDLGLDDGLADTVSDLQYEIDQDEEARADRDDYAEQHRLTGAQLGIVN